MLPEGPCQRCEQAGQRIVDAQEETSAVLESLKDLRRQNGRLKAELTKMRDVAPAGEVEEVFSVWQYRCNRPAHRLLAKRRELIAKAVKQQGLHHVLEAIRGYSRFPYVCAAQRAKDGAEGERFDLIEMICRDETMVDKGVALAKRADREDGCSRPGETPWPVGLFSDREVIRPEPGYMDVDRVPVWLIPCSAHGNGTLRGGQAWVHWGGRDGRVVVRCAKGCREADVLRSYEQLRDSKGQLGMAA